jgi:hypothetical protein
LTLTGSLRKFVLAVHVATAVGALGAVAVFLILAIIGLASEEAQLARAVYPAMNVATRFVIVPFLFAAFLIGLVQSLTTPWGLFRHYWVLVKLLLTVFTIIVLLLQMDGIAYVASLAAERELAAQELLELRRSLRFHAAGGLLVLLLTVVLSIYKPRGVTRYGWRKQHERGAAQAGADG